MASRVAGASAPYLSSGRMPRPASLSQPRLRPVYKSHLLVSLAHAVPGCGALEERWEREPKRPSSRDGLGALQMRLTFQQLLQTDLPFEKWPGRGAKTKNTTGRGRPMRSATWPGKGGILPSRYSAQYHTESRSRPSTTANASRSLSRIAKATCSTCNRRYGFLAP